MLRSLIAVAVVGACALVPLGSAGASSTTAKRIAYVSGGQLWTIGANGTGTTNLGGSAVSSPSTSSDGQTIVFADGSNIESIPAAGPAGAATVLCAGTEPSISPDGQKVAYVSGGSVKVNQLGCGTGTPVDFGAGSSPSWSPDGTQIVFVDAGGAIEVAPSAGGAPQNLGSTPAADPSWSPDGAKIAYVSGGELFTMDASGTNRQQLTSTAAAESSPSWAPGGDEIVYAANGQLLAIAPGASVTRLFPDAANASEPSWGVAVANTGRPAITAQAGAPIAEGTELAADPRGTWISISAITSYGYRWQRCNTAGSGCTNIPGAVSDHYTLASGDVGSTVRVVVTATTSDGSAPGTSNPTAVVAAAAPNNTQPPVVSGNFVAGETLTASTGTWRGTSLVYSYQWQKCDSAGSNCANVSGATANIYVPSTGDVGSRLRVLVTATNSLGSATKSSDPTPVIASKTPVNTTLPAVIEIIGLDGTVTSYTSTPGTWTGASSITYTYQWRRCDSAGSNCKDIAAATLSSYFPTALDYGSRLRIAVTATNTYGTATAVSEPSNVLVGAAPVNTVRPSISGTPSVGSVLFALNGTWTGATPITFAYEWRRCNASGGSCVAIGGEAAQSYVVRDTDVGSTIVVAVTARNAAGNATLASAPTGVVQQGTPSASRPAVTTPPSISGVLAKGKTLTANRGTWSGTTPISFRYEWQRCGDSGSGCISIPSATRTTYTLVSADVGKRIRLMVMASNTAGSALAFSAVSGKVAAKAVAGKTLKGTAKADRLSGGAGADTIHGGGGNDRISGGAGADKLYGDAGNDSIDGGAGADAISGGSGNDTINARDGERDTIDCGSGKDTVVADESDVVKACETVRR